MANLEARVDLHTQQIAELQVTVDTLKYMVANLERKGVSAYQPKKKLLEMVIVDAVIDGFLNTIKFIFRRLRRR